ncbi:MAG TPA: serine/threonine-protein kinase [Ktedonobacterales bacterium]|nr:serine/threonine-protein kinase [Ktedonobacterales bacterium]
MLHLEGREVGGCKLVRKIGEGGMGEVYLGEQIRVGNRAVAVKIVRADDEVDDAKITDIAKKFEREAALLGGFNHQNILPVHDYGVQGDLLYLVMQYAPDGSLADAIKGRTQHTLTLPASPTFVADLIGQVAAALQYTHDRGVVHRDVKPGNVLLQLEPNGHWHALLADFGIARGTDASSHRTQVSGTLAYMAPEQFSGKFSPASDQYALAVMTYQLLTSHTPFEGDLASLTKGHMYETPPSVRSYNAALPASVDGVLNRALAKDPAQRYPSVSEYSKALQAALAQKPGANDAVPPPLPIVPATVPAGGRISQGPAPQWPAGPQGRGARQPRPPRKPGLGRVWVALLAAVVLLVAIVGAGGYIVQQQQNQQKSAQQTQAAQTAIAQASQTSVSLTATAGVTVTPQVTPIATATAKPVSISDDVTTPPPPPAGAGISPSPVLSDPSPTCGNPPVVSWSKNSNTNTSCPVPVGGGVDVKAIQTSSTAPLACMRQVITATSQTDGYFTVIAQPVSGTVVMGFRSGQGALQGSQFNVTGYFYVVNPSDNTVSLFTSDSQGHIHQVQPSTQLGGTLNKHFAVSALYKGSQITLYINGIQVGTVTDSTYPSGWVSLCTSNETIFSDAILYNVGS